MSSEKVCLLTGVGPGTGSSLVKRFVKGGYSVAMLARTEERLENLAKDHPEAHAFVCDVSDTAALTDTLKRVKSELGVPRVVVHNAVGGAFGTFMEIDPVVLERNFQINTMALLHLARQTVPDMIELGGGALICTGNTSAYRGKAGFAGFAPTKAAQRILLQSIARDAGPKGVHAGFVAIDAVIDVPWTRERFADKPDDFFCKPDDIAEECYHMAHQAKSVWAHEIVIRPYGEPW
jgi:NAD(P)-dependent dehydrogenase (short-subunit alcohol dehydrogenase family)